MSSTGAGRAMSVFTRIGRMFSRREPVGLDAAGNEYFRWREKNHEGEMVEKRVVDFSGGDYDPTSIPPMWKSWLQGARHDPPSEEDQKNAMERAAALAVKVAAIEQEEAQRRMRARSLESSDQQEHNAAAMTSLLGGGGSEGPPPHPTSSSSPPQQQQQQEEPPSAASSAFEPDAWQPGSSSGGAGK